MVLALLLAALPLAAAPPRLIVDASPSTTAAAARIDSYDPARLESIVRLTGAPESQPPIHVILAAEGSLLARRAPAWISGWAYPELGTIVLIPSREVRYPSDGLEELLRHEVAHVLIERAALGRPVPRWFHEGLAMLAARGWTLEDRGRLVFELMSGDEKPIEEVERSFRGGESGIAAAYSFSGAFVRELVRRHGQAAPAQILRRTGSGVPFDRAFLDVTGETVIGAERDFWRRQTIWNRWVPFLTSSLALWMVITLLAMWAMGKRHARDAAIRQQWAEADPEQTEDIIN